MKILASILACNPLNLGDDICKLEEAGTDSIHIDIADGHYVKNFTFGINTVSSVSKLVSIPVDVHLQVCEPEMYIKDFADAGAKAITVHLETCRHPIRLLNTIRKYGLKSCIAINPHVPVDSVKLLLDYIDSLLLMSAEPGFGGQKFLSIMVEKATEARSLVDKAGKGIEIGVDGGITFDNALQLVDSGVDFLNVGTALFSGGRIQDNVRRFKAIKK